MAKSITLKKNTLLHIKKNLEKTAAEITANVIKNMEYIGERSVAIAREKGSYNDITGNLRSSIGYVVLSNGIPVAGGGFKQTQGRGANMSLVQYKTKSGKEVKYWAKGASGDGSVGVSTGKELLKKLQAKYSSGIVLIVCAGMEYAAYVEDIHHKDVLVSAELESEKLANKLLKHLTDD